ncbi:MAG: hypothetical protein JWN45_2702 [Acidobacteriaceae bacterium]|nr:hypothetical protein [Acidobacteriaceae bacterium]
MMCPRIESKQAVLIRITAIIIAIIPQLCIAQNGTGISKPATSRESDSRTDRRGANVKAGPESTGSKPDSSSEPEKNTIGRQLSTPSLERSFAINFIRDQRDIWMSPLRLKRKDSFWLVPAAGIVAGIMYRDVDAYRGLSVTDAHAQTSKTFSDMSVVALGASVGGLYFLGRFKANDHAHETGILGSEALANSLAVTYGLKYMLRRQRPFDGDGQGGFFQPSGDSFPSAHAMAAWSMAAVLAREYPGPLTKIGVYGLASAISLARVTGRQHFPSDVVVGSALGWAIGNQVYKRHHDADLPGVDIGTIHPVRDEGTARGSLGSTYVPLDSWVYPAIDRLTAMGLIRSGFSGLKPWTRMECLGLVEEADESLGNEDSVEPEHLIESLKAEFAMDAEVSAGTLAPVFRLDSVYSRVTAISGQPLTDGYHFGETIYNDYGRPYQEGFNAITGISGSATHGRWAFYVQGEYQHSPSAPGLSAQAMNAIAIADFTPVQPSVHTELNQFRLLDAYASYTINNWQFSFGKQSLWWGPGENGALNFSNNAEPVPMFRVSRVTPMKLPSVFGFLGPVRTEFFLGQLSGHTFVRTANGLFGPSLSNQPLLHGEKFSFKPTPNLEFGFSETTVWGGPGLPLNFRALLNSYSLGNTVPGQDGDPGDRRSGFDFSYRVPKLRNWLILYSDAFTEDEFSPISFPRKSSFRPGIYLPRLPWVHKLDFRAEGVYTDIPNLNGDGVAYSNNRFLNGYTNRSQLLGDWIGREGSGFNASSTYWFSGRKKLQLAYRNANVNPNFIGGGRYDDFRAGVDWEFGPTTSFSVTTQYERWKFPVLSLQQQSDLSTSIMFVLHPRSKRPLP